MSDAFPADIQLHGEPADRIVAGLRQLVAQLQAPGLEVVVVTLTPFEATARGRRRRRRRGSP